uniref:Uncharacterized protein n=1 Tax=Romanomermis culicivorax TaxID=13658 RepID=A0A915LA89_ROMCU
MCKILHKVCILSGKLRIDRFPTRNLVFTKFRKVHCILSELFKRLTSSSSSNSISSSSSSTEVIDFKKATYLINKVRKIYGIRLIVLIDSRKI